MDTRNNKTKIERISMPDGSELDVVFAPKQKPVRRKAAPNGAPTLDDLAVCAQCDCEMVYPIDWERVANESWKVTLRCPNCEEIASGVFDEDLVEQFDALLDRGTDSLVRDLRNLTYANMATEINGFIKALNADFVLPEDF